MADPTPQQLDLIEQHFNDFSSEDQNQAKGILLRLRPQSRVLGAPSQPTGAPGSPPGSPPRDTFLGESGLAGVGQFLHGLFTDPQHTVGPNISNAILGQGQDISKYTQQAGPDALKALFGSPNFTSGVSAGNDFLRDLVGMVPIAGHPAAHFIDNARQGNWGGALGDLFSLAALRGPKTGAELGEATEAGGRALFQRNIKFPEKMSLQEQQAAVEMAMDKGFPIKSKAALNAIGDVTDPKSYLGDLENQVQAEFRKGGRGAIQVDQNIVFKHLQDEIANSMNDHTAEGKAYTQALQRELHEARTDYSRGLTAGNAQLDKRTLYKRIAESQYSDTSTGIPAAAAKAKEELARGLKDAIQDKIPEVGDINDRMHTAIQLKTALTKAQKSTAKGLTDWVPWLAVGLGAGGELAGHPLAGPAMLGGLALRQALKDPAIASRIALATRAAPAAGRGAGVAGLGFPFLGVQPQQNPSNQ